jgi:DNA-binding NtrC family response regulator
MTEQSRLKILVVDDESSSRDGLSELLESWGYFSLKAKDGEEAVSIVRDSKPNIMICDLKMPRMDGLEVLRQTGGDSGITFIMLTAQGTIDSAVEAIKLGAYDYLTKPIDIVRLKNMLLQIDERLGIETEIKVLKQQLRQLGSFGSMTGKTPIMQEIFHQIEVAAPSTASVLISGSSGTGKELVAKAVHELSPRKASPFIAINCAAIPENLLESEIFGHEKGAFTGAIKTKEGCYELADHGTLFLDEITQMAMDLQTKLLRVIETGTYRRVGGKDELKADVRIVAASNLDFAEAVRNKLLRDDLYYRLNVFHIHLPDLRQRIADIPLLVQTFIDDFNKKNEKEIKAVDHEVINILKAYPWPGNVRELKNVIERAVIVAKGELITLSDLPPSIIESKSKGPEISFKLGMSIEEIEKDTIIRTLEYSGGNKTEAAKILGISLKTLHNKLKQYKLK